MIISFYGEGCFKIQSADNIILTDPTGSESGLTPPRFKHDILIKTLTALKELDITKPAEAEEFKIIGPGEYNIKDTDITGLGLVKESSAEFIKTIYLVKMESIKMCFLGHLSEMPEPDILEKLEEIDILFVPAGDNPFIERKLAIKLIKQIEPKIVVPTFYKVPGLKRTAGNLKDFIEESGLPKIEGQEKLTIKKKDLMEIKKTEIAVLKI